MNRFRRMLLNFKHNFNRFNKFNREREDNTYDFTTISILMCYIGIVVAQNIDDYNKEVCRRSKIDKNLEHAKELNSRSLLVTSLIGSFIVLYTSRITCISLCTYIFCRHVIYDFGYTILFKEFISFDNIKDFIYIKTN